MRPRVSSSSRNSGSLDDEVKEARLQKASLTLFGKLFSMLLRTAVCLLVSFVPLILADWAGWAAQDEVIPLFYSWQVILATVVAFVIVWRWR